jgi:hypothetical protein
MSQPTAPIPAIVKHTVIDAITDARRLLTKAAHRDVVARHTDPDTQQGRHILNAAQANLDWLNWVHDLVLHDQHDSTMHLRIGGVVVALEDIAPAMGNTGAHMDAAGKLKVAGLLLQQARRAATMDAVIRDIHKAAIDISAKAGELCEDAIARSIEAQANRIAQHARR